MEKVLVIDDDQLVVRLAELIIRNMRLQPIAALSGKAGLSLAEKERPALIILDLMMPEMNGWETLARIRANEAIRQIPVIILTARVGATGQILESEDKPSYEAFIPKPFSIKELSDKIEEILHDNPPGQNQSQREEKPPATS